MTRFRFSLLSLAGATAAIAAVCASLVNASVLVSRLVWGATLLCLTFALLCALLAEPINRTGGVEIQVMLAGEKGTVREATVALEFGKPPFPVDGQTVLKLDRKRRIVNSIGMILVAIPAGEFLMGAPDSDDLAQKDEKPRHRVRLSQSFFLGEREITVAQFRAFVRETGFQTAAETDGKGTSGYDATRRGFEYNSAKYSWQNPGYPQDDTPRGQRQLA
jgi:formylglycine-generating enzyme required for sulfatase activity